VTEGDTVTAIRTAGSTVSAATPKIDPSVAVTVVTPVDSAVAQRCARLHVPDPRAERDALIAATALVHGMTIVTRNTSDFESTGAQILTPWT